MSGVRLAAAHRAFTARLAARPIAAACGGMAVASAASWLRLALERTLAIDTCTWPYFVACGLAGLGLVVAAAASLQLGRSAGSRSWRSLLGGAALLQLVAALALPLTSRDVYFYLGVGFVEAAGKSAYLVPAASVAPATLLAVSDPKWAIGTSPYGPLMNRLARVAVTVGQATGAPLWGPLAAWKALMLLASLAALGLAAAHLRRRDGADGRGVFALFAFSPLLAWELSAQAHNDGLLVLAATAFLALFARGRRLAGLAALAAGALVKAALAPLLALGLLLSLRRVRWRPATLALVIATLALAAAGMAVCAVTSARGSPWGEIARMLVSDPAHRSHSVTQIACFLLERLRGEYAATRAYVALSRTAVLVACALLARAAWGARDLPSLVRGFTIFSLGLLATTPWFQPWYPAWILPGLLVEPDPRWRRLVAVYAAASVVLWIAPLDPVTTVALHAWVCLQAYELERAPAALPSSAQVVLT